MYQNQTLTNRHVRTQFNNYKQTLPDSRRWFHLCIGQLLRDAYLVCRNTSHCFGHIFMVVSPSLPPKRLIKSRVVFLFSNSSASLLYLFTFRWNSHTVVRWNGILISCNFPALMWTSGTRREAMSVASFTSTNEGRMRDGQPSLLHYTLQVSYMQSIKANILWLGLKFPLRKWQ